jgi:hypothetical protein
MDISFHYYGTYTAARLAGFNVDEATTIAYSAQYVDDSIAYFKRILNKGEYGLTIQPIATCQDPVMELGWSGFSGGFIGPILEEMRKVWVPFHFLPGNYRSQASADLNWKMRLQRTNGGVYAGPKNSGYIFGWVWDPVISQKEFQHICLPRSPLALAMVNRDPQRSKPEWLHKLGIMMHVYADTGAHMYHAGTPAWHVNEAYSDVMDQSVQLNERLNWAYGDWLACYMGKNVEACAPVGPTVRFPTYLGHGRMGHLPDYPWMCYKYLPYWYNATENSGNWVIKNNPETYLNSFMDMILALQFQRGSITEFNYGQNEELINSQIVELREQFSHELSTVKCILNTKPYKASSYKKLVDQMCLAWQDALNDDNCLGKYGGVPVKYDPDKWVNDVMAQKTGIENTDYFKFHRAAIDHRDFVINSLSNEGIWLGVQ